MNEDWTWHGGRLAQARAHFGAGAAAWIDLTTANNPDPGPADAIAVDWRGLPDPQALAGLEAAAARYFGVDPAHVCALPGTETGLRLLSALIDLPARHFAPAYRTHGAVFPHSRPVADFTRREAGASALLLANPNNPDGRIFAAERLREWLGWIEAERGWLIVDEAFADAQPALSLAAEMADERRLILFRSFGKFFGLAGLRLGFVLAPREIIAGYRRLLGEWPISSAGLAIGTAAYRDDGWIAATRAALPDRAARLDAVLQNRGYRPIGQCPLFRLIEADDAHALFEHLARRAILTRPFEDNRRWLRIGLPAGEAELDRLDWALADG
jgi:cobalamin biosynthetic protein CobC